mmetsp:Transcript_110385/g.293205  ORF Transcript_110385/g.293205 Transcript_110385/m.293205 type:complete len:347 (-) Transcript_110385:77-1117(-)
MESELVIAYIILFFALLAVLVCCVIHQRVRKQASAKHDPEVPEVAPPPPPPTSWPWQLTWLATLTGATLALLVLQVALGLLTGALLLLADAAHGAADAATYGLAAFVEFMKYSFGRQAVGREVGARADKASALFSALVVSVTSVAVAVEAGIRVWKRTGREDSETLGDAMLIVASLGVCMNLALLWLHSHLSRGSEGEEALERASPRAAGRSPARGGRPRRAGVRFSLHAALHPGCQGDCQSPETPLLASEGQNLNVYGVLLHVCTDVVRTLLMLVVGVLVRRGILLDAPRVDAICAIVICGCVVLGSAWLLRTALSPLPPLVDKAGLTRGTKDGTPTASYGAAGS